jgi:uncharacterized protein (DUF1697 family)
MKRYICILRGVNVGGHRKILMKDLVILLEKEKLQNVKTYIQSGNIAFNSDSFSHTELATKIKSLIEKEYGFVVPVIILTKKEIEETIQNLPFSNVIHTHVTFLKSAPSKELVESLNLIDYSPEQFVVKGNVVYLKSIEKYHQLKLSNQFFEKALKVTATTRNWKTVIKLKELAEA